MTEEQTNGPVPEDNPMPDAPPAEPQAAAATATAPVEPPAQPPTEAAATTAAAPTPATKIDEPTTTAPAAATTEAAAPAAPPAPSAPAPLSIRQYLETTVVPILMTGMQQLSKERPEDPIAWLSDYLKANNPKKS